MQLSIEMSLYPLADEYIPVIKEFIDRLNSHSELTVYTNTMSTQVFGDFDVLMTVFQAELKKLTRKFPVSVWCVSLLTVIWRQLWVTTASGLVS